MTFENPTWLYLTPLLLLLVAALLFLGSRKREALLGKFAATRLMGQLTAKASLKRQLIKSLCILLGIAGIGLALSRPQYGIEWSERKARGLDLIFTLDTSRSMLATDLRPTRLIRAKLAVMDVINKLESDRIGLVAFAGRAFLQTPPTLDYAAFRESLEALGPGTMTLGGSDLGGALREAEKAFPKDNNFKAIILLTDGEDLGGDAIEAAKELAAKQVKVYTVGIGTPEGAVLRVRNDVGSETVVRDSQGEPVLTRLDEAALIEIAQITGGRYSRLSSQSLDSLYDSVLATLPRTERAAELKERRIERFQWLLAAAFGFLTLELLIRRRGRSSIPAALLLASLATFSPQPAQAQDATAADAAADPAPQDARVLYNQAYQSLRQGDLSQAQTLYENAIRGTQDLQLQANSLYNLALADYQLGRQSYQASELQPALEHLQSSEARLKSVLEIDPQDAAAASDVKQVTQALKMIEQIIKQQQEEEQQQQQDEQQQQDQEQQQQSSESEDSQSEQSESGEPSPSESGEPSPSESGEDESSDASEQQDDASQSESESDAQSADAESENNTAPTPGEEVPMTEETPSESDSAAGTQVGEPIEGMSESEAQALLDSLRSGEKLLPLAAPRGAANSQNIRDW
jgi:Ca-activated chloride channel family protein